MDCFSHLLALQVQTMEEEQNIHKLHQKPVCDLQ